FFFFQAEDGIRDFHVTGVQTCALPISISSTTSKWGRARAASSATGRARELVDCVATNADACPLSRRRIASTSLSARIEATIEPRSEERRVGKEGRSRGSAEESKTKEKT